MAKGKDGEPTDWVTRAADDAIRHAGAGASIVTVSSGASPSGRVHLGNLREFLTVHFVADELARRGVPVRHLHVWDDFDRFRKVPVGVDPAWSEHIGRPLSKVPDPDGCHDSWAEHFKAPLRDALHAMGVDMEEVSQTERYEAGHYRDAVLTAVRQRDAIEAVLARHRTKAVELESADDDEASGSGDLSRFPYKPYCRDCGRDTVTLTAYDDDTTELSYTCDFNGYTGATNLTTEFEGKLVWKVDWPMRWAFEHVDFEPAGMDHATPGSSFTVGHSLVEDIFGMPPAGVVRLRLRRVRRRAEDVVVGGRRPHRRGRAQDPGGADPALALRAPQPQADLQHRLRGRGGAALRRVGRARPQGAGPVAAGRAGAGLRARRVDGDGRHPARSREGRVRSGCCRRSPTSPNGDSAQISRIVGGLGRGPANRG